jgi:hypothetical protein
MKEIDGFEHSNRLTVPINLDSPDKTFFVNNYTDMAKIHNSSSLTEIGQTNLNSNITKFNKYSEDIDKVSIELSNLTQEYFNSVDDAKSNPSAKKFITLNIPGEVSYAHNGCYKNLDATSTNFERVPTVDNVDITREQCTDLINSDGANSYVTNFIHLSKSGGANGLGNCYKPKDIGEVNGGVLDTSVEGNFGNSHIESECSTFNDDTFRYYKLNPQQPVNKYAYIDNKGKAHLYTGDVNSSTCQPQTPDDFEQVDQPMWDIYMGNKGSDISNTESTCPSQFSEYRELNVILTDIGKKKTELFELFDLMNNLKTEIINNTEEFNTKHQKIRDVIQEKYTIVKTKLMPKHLSVINEIRNIKTHDMFNLNSKNSDSKLIYNEYKYQYLFWVSLFLLMLILLKKYF